MKRIVSVWLPHWPIERLLRQSPGAIPDDVPAALVASGAHGLCITATNTCAASEGIRPGASLADSRAAVPHLISRPAAPFADARALIRLARWLGRYGPFRHTDGQDGIWIEITGVAHLFGGERGLASDLVGRLSALGITARVGLADTLGAAHALARFAATAPHASPPSGGGVAIAPRGETAAALSALPIEGLRLAGDAVTLLRRLGLKRIGQLYDLPRASLEQRFRSHLSTRSGKRDSTRLAAAVLTRLDQALGLSSEPRRALAEPPLLAVRRSWSEPLASSEALTGEISGLAGELVEKLRAAGLGARGVTLALYRADGTIAAARVHLSRASADARHILRLLRERLAGVDAGFGIDVAVMEARAVERMPSAQASLDRSGEEGDDATRLLDRLATRLGSSRIHALAPRASHIPERAEVRVPPLQGAPTFSGRTSLRPPRPHLIISPPEPVSVMAEVPEGPPLRFTWRRVLRAVARSEGPERIAPEWWRDLALKEKRETSEGVEEGESGLLGEPVARSSGKRPRDYYIVEDQDGARYWLYREGFYGAPGELPPRWFLHGLF